MQPVKANWRWVDEGSTIWFEVRNSWYPGTIHSIGKNRKERTIANIAPEAGGALVSRQVADLYARKPDLNGVDIPAGNMALAF